ncbi:threonine/serine exporter family protein [Clostridium sp. MB40-C1]|uniref:threonine/serine exporter family protein n=1 Tax=Clostridium sp. MB40-C1 TaxID=3070996 RepID=UPI0027DFD9C4|nr:threonine/serine exporter family protein [Clostridium sp. MB40-C1]WMJ81280.1 threonine/serine exporter family protein [Clostridium sp. MB40-C1]
MNRSYKLLHIAVKAGEIILQSGGETYRVEETMRRICYAFNMNQADCFVTPTGIMLSIIDKNGETYSVVKRINTRTVNLEKISMVNDLSRSILPQKLTLDEVNDKLNQISNTRGFSSKVLVIAASFAAGFFTLLFGGDIKDFLVSLVIGLIIKIVFMFLNKIQINEFFINSLCGAIASFIAILSIKLNIGHDADKIIIGSIMILVPGLLITNAIRDTISGDLVSGISRAVEAFFIAIAIAVGSGLVIKIWSLVSGGIII